MFFKITLGPPASRTQAVEDALAAPQTLLSIHSPTDESDRRLVGSWPGVVRAHAAGLNLCSASHTHLGAGG